MQDLYDDMIPGIARRQEGYAAELAASLAGVGEFIPGKAVKYREDAGRAQDGDGKLAQRSHHSWAAGGADAGMVLVELHAANTQRSSMAPWPRSMTAPPMAMWSSSVVNIWQQENVARPVCLPAAALVARADQRLSLGAHDAEQGLARPSSWPEPVH
jgi:hypothetical protein